MESRYERLPSIQEPKPMSQTEDVEQAVSTWRHRLSHLRFLVIQLLGLIWLVPIILLLYVNFNGHIIGPSAWCPPQGCKTDSLTSGNFKWTLELDRNDHNILGALQLVAKALEIWFFFVAGSLVYNIAMLVASREGGLPIGLFSSPTEFSDPRSLYDMFRAATSDAAHPGTKKQLLLKPRLFYFVSFVLFMCLLVNVMGPAVAVLVLPTLQWVDLPLQAQHRFNASAIGRQPIGADFKIFPNCSGASLADRLYSCTSIPYASSLDLWTDALQASERQMSSAYRHAGTGASPEGEVFFMFNTSKNYGYNNMFWAPNRQTLREISADLEYFSQGTQNLGANPGYRQYNQSLDTILKRKGPVFGAAFNGYVPDNTIIIQLAPNKAIRCYGGYQYHSDATTTQGPTKCLRVGTAWTALNKEANFKLSAAQDRSINARVFFSDKAAFFDRDFTSDLISSTCFTNGTLASPNDCDFEAVFSTNRTAHFTASSSNILTVEWSMSENLHGPKWVIEFLTFADFATYVLDTSSRTNPLHLVRIDDVPDVRKRGLRTIPVDPDWFLAAWSVDQGGLVTNRSSSTSLIRFFESYFGRTFSDDGSPKNTAGSGSLTTTSTTSSSVSDTTTISDMVHDIETTTTFPTHEGSSPTFTSASMVIADMLSIHQSSTPTLTSTSNVIADIQSTTTFPIHESSIPTFTSTSSVISGIQTTTFPKHESSTPTFTSTSSVIGGIQTTTFPKHESSTPTFTSTSSVIGDIQTTTFPIHESTSPTFISTSNVISDIETMTPFAIAFSSNPISTSTSNVISDIETMTPFAIAFSSNPISTSTSNVIGDIETMTPFAIAFSSNPTSTSTSNVIGDIETMSNFVIAFTFSGSSPSTSTSSVIGDIEAPTPLIITLSSTPTFTSTSVVSETSENSASGPIQRRQGFSTSATTPADDYYDFIATPPAAATSTSSRTDGITVIPTASLSPSTDEISGDFGQSNQTSPDSVIDEENSHLLIAVVSYWQALSMVTYSQTNLTQPNQDTNDAQHPPLWYWARVHVWAYGTGSRTSKMGIVVTMLGGICVIASFILSLMTKRRQKSVTDLLIAAVEHTHQGELHQVVGNEALKKKVRYRFRKEEDGVLRFDAL